MCFPQSLLHLSVNPTFFTISNLYFNFATVWCLPTSIQLLAETLVLWPPHVKSWLIGKDFDAGRDWGQEKKRTTEDEMAGWHHGLDGRESEWTAGVGDGQGGLACCNSWDHKESDTTEWLNWTILIQLLSCFHLNLLFLLLLCFSSTGTLSSYINKGYRKVFTFLIILIKIIFSCSSFKSSWRCSLSLVLKVF